MKRFFFFFFINFLFSSIYAQKVSVEDILSSAKSDDRVISNIQTTSFTEGLDYHLPFLRKVDVRFGINGNTTSDTLDGTFRNEDYYALQFSTNNFKEMRLQKALKPAQLNVFVAEKQLLLHQAFLERYQAIAVFFYGKKLYETRSKLLNLLTNKEEVLTKMLDEGITIRFKDVMDTQNDKNTLSTVLLDYENNVNFQTQRIKQYLKIATDIPLDIDFQGFITPNTIEKNVLLLKSDTSFLHPIVNFKQAQTAYSTAENAYERAQFHQVLSYVQVGYARPTYTEILKKYNPQNNVALRIGMTVPLPSNNNLKRAKTALQQKEDAQSTILTRQLQQKAIALQFVKVENLLKSLRLNEKNTNESMIKKMLDNQSLLAQLTPVEILDLRITQFKTVLRNVEISADLTNEYIRLLELTGALSKYDNRNFLKEQ